MKLVYGIINEWDTKRRKNAIACRSVCKFGLLYDLEFGCVLHVLLCHQKSHTELCTHSTVLSVQLSLMQHFLLLLWSSFLSASVPRKHTLALSARERWQNSIRTGVPSNQHNSKHLFQFIIMCTYIVHHPICKIFHIDVFLASSKFLSSLCICNAWKKKWWTSFPKSTYGNTLILAKCSASLFTSVRRCSHNQKEWKRELSRIFQKPIQVAYRNFYLRHFINLVFQSLQPWVWCSSRNICWCFLFCSHKMRFYFVHNKVH